MKEYSVFTASWGQVEGKYSNMGDIIIFEAILEMLNSIPSIKKIYCYSSDVEYTNKKYNVFSEDPFSIKGILKTIMNISKSDLILLGGGELVQTKSSFMYLIANLAPAFFAWIFGKKCAAIGVGIGSDEEVSSFGKVLAIFILKKIDAIHVRDSSSLKNTLALGIRRDKIVQTTDLAFYFESNREYSQNRNNNTILFCPRFTKFRTGSMLPASIKKRLYYREYLKYFNNYAAKFGELLKKLTYEHNVIILPSYNGKNFSCSDFAFTKKIYALAGSPKNAEIYHEDITAVNMLKLLNKTFMTVGVPLHSLILTSIVNNPIIAISYSSKCSSFMKDLDLEEFIIDISESFENLNITKILSLIQACKLRRNEIRMKIEKKVHYFHNQNNINYNQIKSLLDV